MLRGIHTATHLINPSTVLYNEDAVVGHYMNEVGAHSSQVNFRALSIFAPSIGFFFEYASMFVLAFLFAYLLGLYLKKSRPWHFPVRLFYSLFSAKNLAFSRCSTVGLLSVSVLFFLFFVQQIIGNNISTEVGPFIGPFDLRLWFQSEMSYFLPRLQKVVVETSQIVDSVESLQKTSKGAFHSNTFQENSTNLRFLS